MKTLATLAVLAAAIAAAGCGGNEADPLTVYSGREEELVAPLFEQFTEATGIGVEVRYGDSAELAAAISEEGDGSPADVFSGASYTDVYRACRAAETGTDGQVGRR